MKFNKEVFWNGFAGAVVFVAATGVALLILAATYTAGVNCALSGACK